MIINTVKGQVKPEFKEKFIAHMAELAETVRAEKGCIAYDLNVDTENELVLFLFEKWESKEDLMAHAVSDHMKEYGKKTKDLVEDKAIHILTSAS